MTLNNTHSESLNDLVFNASQIYPENIALKFFDGQINYRDLNIKALEIASSIIANCSEPLIGLIGSKSISAYLGLLGILYSGGAYVPLNPKQPIEKLIRIAKNTKIKTFLVCPSSINVAEKIKAALGNEIKFIIIDDVKVKISINAPIKTRCTDLAYVIFTSGSTGEPKGVMVSHSNIVSHIRSRSNYYSFSPHDILCQTFDLNFDPSIGTMFSGLACGSSIYVMQDSEMTRIDDVINNNQITYWASVPTLALFLFKTGRLSKNSLPTLRYSAFVGEPLSISIADKWMEAANHSSLTNWYGPTEATVDILYYEYKKGISKNNIDFKNGVVPIGQPLPGHLVVLVDENLKKIEEPGVVGQIAVSGGQVTLGYLNDENKTTEKFVAMNWDLKKGNRWYLTGDLGVINSQKDFECLGRNDNQIKISGQRMELGEIEYVFKELFHLDDIYAIAHTKEGLPAKVYLFGLKADFLNKEVDPIIALSKKMLPSVFVPIRLIQLNSIPLNDSGKVNRVKLMEILENEINIRKI